MPISCVLAIIGRSRTMVPIGARWFWTGGDLEGFLEDFAFTVRILSERRPWTPIRTRVGIDNECLGKR